MSSSLSIALVHLDLTGHHEPMIALGRELIGRGHHVVSVGAASSPPAFNAGDIDFIPFDPADDETPEAEPGPSENLPTLWSDVILAFNRVVSDLPALVLERGIDLIIADDVLSHSVKAVADSLDIPYVSLSCGFPYIVESGEHAGVLVEKSMRAFRHFIAPLRERWSLPPVPGDDLGLSPLAHLSQAPPSLILPGRKRAPHFHPVGPLRIHGPQPSYEFPFDRLDGRPLIFASLGTVNNRGAKLYEFIAAACADTHAQLVLSLGRRPPDDFLGRLSGDPLVVPFAPHSLVFPRTDLVITHAGFNTTLDALTHGIPLVAIPLANDQLVTGDVIEEAGVARKIPATQASPELIRKAITEVRADENFRHRAREIADELSSLDGVKTGADIIETAAATRAPVLRAT